MKDRMLFDIQILSNGITVYQQDSKVEYTTVYLQVPVGSAHNTSGVLPGTYHFLEHVCFERSKLLPENESFSRMAGLLGGWANAHTHPFRTTYELSVPNKHLTEALPALFSAAFEPLLQEETISRQRTIISSERSRNPWYPGENEVGKYINSLWMRNLPYSLEQLFGTDTDLSNMDPENLAAAHQNYLSSNIVMMAVGSGDVRSLVKQLAALVVSEKELPTSYEPVRWIGREYHEHSFRDVGRYDLRVGGFVDRSPGIRTVRQLSFICNYLINHFHGPLYRWLRHEKGWVYELGFHANDNPVDFSWILYFPLSTREQVEIVRKEWRARARIALADAEALQREVDRLIGHSVYWDETADTIIKSALDTLGTYGQVITNTEWCEHIRSCSDTSALIRLFDTYFSEEATGSFLAVPQNS